jgi:Flp pilus assembly protein TadB
VVPHQFETPWWDAFNRSSAKSAQRQALEVMEQTRARTNSKDYGLGDFIHKCPNCGYVQSWIVRSKKKTLFKALFELFLVFCAVFVFFGFLALNEGDINFPSLTILAAVILVAGIALLANFRLNYDPNKKLLKNKTQPTEQHQPIVKFIDPHAALYE